MKYFVGCLGPLNDACQSSIIYVARVYTGYYHAIRLHTFPDSLLYFLILCPFRRFQADVALACRQTSISFSKFVESA